VSWRQLTATFDPKALDLSTVPGRLKRAAAIWSEEMSNPNDAAAIRAGIRQK